VPPVRPNARAWFTAPDSAVKEKLTQFDLNLPYSRAVEMYRSGGMLKPDCRTRAAAVHRKQKPGRPDGCPEWKRAGKP